MVIFNRPMSDEKILNPNHSSFSVLLESVEGLLHFIE